MDTYGPAVFFIVLTIGTIGSLLIINLRGALLNTAKSPVPARLLRGGEPLRRRVERRPNVICILPMYEQLRPEQPLW